MQAGHCGERIFIRVLHPGLFPLDRACDLRKRCTARDRCEPLGADGVWTKRGPPTAASNARLIAEPGCRLPLVSSGSGDTGVCLSGDHDTVRGPTRRDDLGFLRRLLGGGQQQPYRRSGWSPEQRPGWMRQGMEVQLYDGRENLEVVGEASYQDNLWRVVGGHGASNDRVRLEVYAVLVAETDNPYDANAISVWIQGLRVGYLSREDARRYRPGLLALERKHGKPIALAGAIVGGGMRADGPGRLGVFFDHDPADFGLRPMAPPRVSGSTMRTGLTDALATDQTAERGIAIYGTDCARADAVEDLQKRAASYRAKLHPQPRPSRPRAVRPNQPQVEVLTCGTCGREFQRTRLRGRKPLHCPECRDQTG
jgi:hypothetical protein